MEISGSANTATNVSPRDDRVPILEMRGISKNFGHVCAVADVNLELYQGEVLALVGDNGAGKSTLIKILSGIYAPSAGDIYLRGLPVKIRNPAYAVSLGISTVYQDLALVETRDVASNIFLGQEPLKYKIIVDRDRMVVESRQLLKKLAIKIPTVFAMVRMLSGGQRQAVSIARAISRGGPVLLLDEPTAALGVEESRHILELIQRVKEQGNSIMIVSHNLRHVFSIADRIFVLRQGRKVGVVPKDSVTPEEVVRMITGVSML